jgi:hypothetical protein
LCSVEEHGVRRQQGKQIWRKEENCKNTAYGSQSLDQVKSQEKEIHVSASYIICQSAMRHKLRDPLVKLILSLLKPVLTVLIDCPRLLCIPRKALIQYIHWY